MNCPRGKRCDSILVVLAEAVSRAMSISRTRGTADHQRETTHRWSPPGDCRLCELEAGGFDTITLTLHKCHHEIARNGSPLPSPGAGKEQG